MLEGEKNMEKMVIAAAVIATVVSVGINPLQYINPLQFV
jgi:outer membrane murein-binding lipoprotein Lpp